MMNTRNFEQMSVPAEAQAFIDANSHLSNTHCTLIIAVMNMQLTEAEAEFLLSHIAGFFDGIITPDGLVKP